jgi:hypothetical protein
MRIDRRMIVQVLAVVNGSMLDFGDGLVDLGDGVVFFTVHMTGVSLMFQVGASMAQVGEGVQVSRMSSRIVCEGHRCAERNEECDDSTMS